MRMKNPGWLPADPSNAEPIAIVTTALIGDLIGLLHGDARAEAREAARQLHIALERATLDALNGMHPATADEALKLRNDYRNALCAAGLWESLVKGEPEVQRANPAECSAEAA